MKYFVIFLAVLMFGCSREESSQAEAREPVGILQALIKSHEITTWKYNASGAYAIIFDDYCLDGVQGIQDHAAPEAEKRGLVIGFGVVTSACDEQEWQRAREMIAAGHEVVNHSHTHRCGDLRSPWCTDVWSDADVDQEIDQPANLIYTHTGVRPTFFIFPFDLFTPSKVDHLRNSGYLGTRTGEKQKLTSADFSDPFTQLNFDVNFPPDSASSQQYGLNEFVDLAVDKGQFAFREVHGVEDQSWGRLTLDELRAHFDYVQAKVKSHQLWMAGISDIIRYRDASRNCPLETGKDERGIWVRLSGDAPVCRGKTELSLILRGADDLEIHSSHGSSVEQINGTYNLTTGETYYLTSR